MNILMKQYYEPARPVPQVVQDCLAELNRLVELNHIEPERFHCSLQPDVMEWGFGSNYEEGWDTLIYQQPTNTWVWREPWEGTDRPVDPEADVQDLVWSLLCNAEDPLGLRRFMATSQLSNNINSRMPNQSHPTSEHEVCLPSSSLKVKLAPQFKHNCSGCIFLGSVVINGVPADIWVHPDQDLGSRYDCVIARLSDEDSDYATTYPAYFSPLCEFLAVAVAMWVRWKGYNGYNWDGTLSKDSKEHLKLYV